MTSAARMPSQMLVCVSDTVSDTNASLIPLQYVLATYRNINHLKQLVIPFRYVLAPIRYQPAQVGMDYFVPLLSCSHFPHRVPDLAGSSLLSGQPDRAAGGGDPSSTSQVSQLQASKKQSLLTSSSLVHSFLLSIFLQSIAI
jgi:hypothetical protein